MNTIYLNKSQIEELQANGRARIPFKGMVIPVDSFMMSKTPSELLEGAVAQFRQVKLAFKDDCYE